MADSLFIDDFNVFQSREKVSGRKKKNRLRCLIKTEIIQSFIFRKYYFKKKERNEILANRFREYLLNTINRLDLETMNISCTEIKLRLFISERTWINSTVILLISILYRPKTPAKTIIYNDLSTISLLKHIPPPLLKHVHVSRNENGKQTSWILVSWFFFE